MEQEKRKAVRVKRTLYIQYERLNNEENKIWDTGNVRDISETGASFIANKTFPVNHSISLRLRLPSNPTEWMDFSGRIVYSAESSTGVHLTRVEFASLKEEHKQALREFVALFSK